jgi:hypothetical protein
VPRVGGALLFGNSLPPFARPYYPLTGNNSLSHSVSWSFVDVVLVSSDILTVASQF